MHSLLFGILVIFLKYTFSEISADVFCLLESFIKFFKFSPGRISYNFFLALMEGVTAGIGILVFIPLLQLSNIQPDIQANSRLIESVGQVISRFGLSVEVVDMLILYTGLIFIIAFIRFTAAVKSRATQQRYICHVRDNLFRKYLHSNWISISNGKMSDNYHLLSLLVQKVGEASYLLLTLITQITLALVFLLLAVLISWKITLIAAALGLVYVLIMLPLNKQAKAAGEKQLDAYKQVFQMLIEYMSNIKIVKMYCKETDAASDLHRVGSIMEEQAVELTKINELTKLLVIALSTLSFSLIFYISYKYLNIELGSVMLLLLVLARMLPLITSVQKICYEALHYVSYFREMNAFEYRCNLHPDTAKAAGALAVFSPKKIHLSNVTFSYIDNGKQKTVFENLTATIDCVGLTLIKGMSGIGKSTLADLIAGLISPTRGSIFLDDVLLDKERLGLWRKQVAYVTQAPYLFNGSIKSNICWANTTATDEEISEAISLCAADFIYNMPKGLDTHVGDNGIKLSGGERQRLCLVRAILSSPVVLILDEATSALDRENEDKIITSLDKLRYRMAIIVIAHNMHKAVRYDREICFHSNSGKTEIHVNEVHAKSQNLPYIHN